ncbi:hypothetical protein [Patulibacter sp. SYSU D01012]|uniref:hypothetical protein n=1 Tax=Patulibacter sp. SYSU D01012 TaxID=2817381 RepID=UPI001B318535|nr:hypothetical protein [Patulibacter sp. SYSU D01012]
MTSSTKFWTAAVADALLSVRRQEASVFDESGFALIGAIAGAIAAGNVPALELAVAGCSTLLTEHRAPQRPPTDLLEFCRQLAFIGTRLLPPSDR